MNPSPSFERIDYLLRANKHIERKIVFDTLQRAAARIGFSKHRYFGFGSMWFADFRFAHRLLRIDKLVSVEHADYAERAAFNRPYAGITVVPGECAEVLVGMSPEAWQAPCIAWFDYDSRLDDKVSSDLSFFVERCAPDSVLLVTVNASRSSYRSSSEGVTKRIETSIGYAESVLGSSSISAQDEPGLTANGSHKDVGFEAFPEFLARCLLSFLARKNANGGRGVGADPLEFVPIVNLAHKDGVDMITVGGAIARVKNRQQWLDSIVDLETGLESSPLVHRRLDLIPLTIKEKLTLDACLPHSGTFDEFSKAVRTLGVRLSDAEIAKYRLYYRHFPVFVEVPI